MVDPKKAGEQADALIAEQNRIRSEAATSAPAAEELPAEVQAIAPEVVEPKTQIDVSAPPDSSARDAEIESLRAQVQVSDQRWNVLQGMIKKKDSEIEQLRLLLAQVSEKAEKPAAPARVANNAVTSQDVEDFGQDMIDLITKISTNVASEVVAEFSRKLDSVQAAVDGVSSATAKSARDVFDSRLSDRVPNWEAINQDPAFMQWVSVVDDFTGRQRVDLLNEAYSNMELDRTAKFFERFISETKAAEPASTARKVQARDPLKLVEPGTSRASAPAAKTTSDTVWTAESIRKLYADQRAGRITADEFGKLERDLFKAQRENRIAA